MSFRHICASLCVVIAMSLGVGTSDRAAQAVNSSSCTVIVTTLSSHLTTIDVDTDATSVFPSNGVGAGGPSQFDASFDRTGNKLYVAAVDGTIRVFSAGSFETITTISQSAHALAASPVRDEIYVADYGNDRMIKIDTTADAVVDSVATGTDPADLVVSPDGNYVYVANSNNVPGSLTRVDSSTFTAVSTPVAIGGAGNDNPTGLVVSPDGTRLFVVGPGGNRLVRVPTAGFTNPPLDLTASVTVGAQNYKVASTSDGSLIFVVSSLGNAAHVIDPGNLTVTATISAGNFPLDLAVTPDDEFLYVANNGSNSVTKIRLADFTTQTIPIGSIPSSITIGGPGCWSPIPDPPHSSSSSPNFAYRATLDPAGGTCRDTTPRTETWTSVFVGYRYLPNASDCTRPGYAFTGWNDTTTSQPTNLPLLTDPTSKTKKHFLAADASLIATWAPLPAAITDLVVFANFFCGPCTNAWLIHSPSDHAAGYDYTVNSTPVTCVVDIEVFGLRACELTALSTGTPFTATVTPRNTHGTGPIRTTTFTLDF